MRSKPLTSISQAQARRIALAAQGFLDPPHDQPTMRTLGRTLGQRTTLYGRAAVA